MKKRKDEMDQRSGKDSILSRIKDIGDKIHISSEKREKDCDCTKMKIEISEELSPDDFE